MLEDEEQADEPFVDNEEEEEEDMGEESGDDTEDDVIVMEEEEDELESVDEIVFISSSAVIGANLTLGGDKGDNKSKSYRDRSMSPNISSLVELFE